MTHFIEVYTTKYDRIAKQCYPLPISYLYESLLKTAECKHLKTVAIFKIKLK